MLNGGLWRVGFASVRNLLKMERETGLEPATSSLGSWHSTTELLPHALSFNDFRNQFSSRTLIAHYCTSRRCSS